MYMGVIPAGQSNSHNLVSAPHVYGGDPFFVCLKCQFKLEKKLSLILCDMFHKYLIRCPIV